MSLAFNGNQVTRFAAQQSPTPDGAQVSNVFPPSSRYHALQVLQYQTESGRAIAYIERRFLPDAANFAELNLHTVVNGDRLDNIAYRYLGDPEQYWRIADANAAMQPEDLMSEAGRTIRITLPEGIPGATRA